MDDDPFLFQRQYTWPVPIVPTTGILRPPKPPLNALHAVGSWELGAAAICTYTRPLERDALRVGTHGRVVAGVPGRGAALAAAAPGDEHCGGEHDGELLHGLTLLLGEDRAEVGLPVQPSRVLPPCTV